MTADRGLAAERTALAWQRNGVSLVAAGIAIARGLPTDGRLDGRPAVGVAVALLGVVTFLVSRRQASRRARHAGLGRPTAEPSDLWPVAASTSLVALAAAVLVLAR